MDFHAYLLRCADGSYYAGHTDNLEQRIGQHQSGTLGGYTARRRPITLVWSERFASRDEAFAAERKLKGWSRAKKEALIAGDWALVSELARNRQGQGSASILRQAQDERGGMRISNQKKTARGELVEPPTTRSATRLITITPTAQAAVLKAAQDAQPREACGLLLGQASQIEAALPTANIHPEPLRHFEIDPAALIAAHKAARAGGQDVLGYFHSHPNGLARPSATDAAMASGDGRIWAIAASGVVTLWRDGPSGFEPLSYRLKDG